MFPPPTSGPLVRRTHEGLPSVLQENCVEVWPAALVALGICECSASAVVPGNLHIITGLDPLGLFLLFAEKIQTELAHISIKLV